MGKTCDHGHLAASCEQCRLEARVKELETDLRPNLMRIELFDKATARMALAEAALEQILDTLDHPHDHAYSEIEHIAREWEKNSVTRKWKKLAEVGALMSEQSKQAFFQTGDMMARLRAIEGIELTEIQDSMHIDGTPEAIEAAIKILEEWNYEHKEKPA